jgi:hypothetical protein
MTVHLTIDLRAVLIGFVLMLVAAGIAAPFAISLADDEPAGEASAAQAIAAGTAFTYQGQLNSAGTPANGPFNLRFTLFSDAAANAVTAGPITIPAVNVANGLFSVELDFGGAPGVFDGNARWLGIEVQQGAGIFEQMTPRQQLNPTPYALYSLGVPWSGITGKPAGFADDVDNDTQYVPGPGLALNVNQFSVQFLAAGPVAGSATSAARSDHNHFGQTWDGSSFTALDLVNNSGGFSTLGAYTNQPNTASVFAQNSGSCTTAGQQCRAIWGNAVSSPAGVDFGGVGVYGRGSFRGVIGVSLLGYGVSGDGPAAGVHGSSSTGTGVGGDSNTGDGVRGSTSSGFGVNGDSFTGYGVFGASSTLSGVYGTSASGIGVEGTSTTSIGVKGTARFAGFPGVYGKHDQPANCPALTPTPSGFCIGVVGEASGTASMGVYGIGAFAGLYGDRLGSGLAGYFNGPVSVGAGFGITCASCAPPLSDVRAKTNVRDLAPGLADVLRLHPVSFDFLPGYADGGAKSHDGLLAQEVRDVLPANVFENGDGMLGLNYPELIPVLIKAIQEQQAQIGALTPNPSPDFAGEGSTGGGAGVGGVAAVAPQVTVVRQSVGPSNAILLGLVVVGAMLAIAIAGHTVVVARKRPPAL